MIFFRSEGHLDRWARDDAHPRGEILPAERFWTLSRTWYAGRLEPHWERASREALQAMLAGVGLTGAFWELP